MPVLPAEVVRKAEILRRLEVDKVARCRRALLPFVDLIAPLPSHVQKFAICTPLASMSDGVKLATRARAQKLEENALREPSGRAARSVSQGIVRMGDQECKGQMSVGSI